MLSPLPFVVSGLPDTSGLGAPAAWREAVPAGLRTKLLLFLPSCCFPALSSQTGLRRWESSPNFCPGSRKVVISQTQCKCGKGERTGEKQDALFLPSSPGAPRLPCSAPWRFQCFCSLGFLLPDISPHPRSHIQNKNFLPLRYPCG